MARCMRLSCGAGALETARSPPCVLSVVASHWAAESRSIRMLLHRTDMFSAYFSTDLCARFVVARSGRLAVCCMPSGLNVCNIHNRC